MKRLFQNVRSRMRLLVRRRVTDARRIVSLLREHPLLVHDAVRGVFVVRTDLTWEERLTLRRALMQHLSEITPRASIPLDDIHVGYYDRCLHRYLHQRLVEGVPNKETCWFRRAQSNRCVGWVDPETPFDADAKAAFLARRAERKKRYGTPGLARQLERDAAGFVFQLAESPCRRDDKALNLCRSIDRDGFRHARSDLNPVILGYSTATETHGVIAGRHRVAALRHLREQGRLPNMEIHCHLVEYPFDSFVYTRPYDEQCKTCKGLAALPSPGGPSPHVPDAEPI